MSKKSCFRGPFNKWHSKRAEKLLKSEWQHLYHIYWCVCRQFTFKKSLWLISKILGHYFNHLTANGKYSLLNRGNLLQQIQMQISQKRKIFSIFFFFFFAFSKFRLNFEHFKKKDDPHSWCIFEFTDSEKRG